MQFSIILNCSLILTVVITVSSFFRFKLNVSCCWTIQALGGHSCCSDYVLCCQGDWIVYKFHKYFLLHLAIATNSRDQDPTFGFVFDGTLHQCVLRDCNRGRLGQNNQWDEKHVFCVHILFGDL